MAPIATLLITAACISCPPINFSIINTLYFLKRTNRDFFKALKFFIIFTPKLDPSLIGFTTKGKENLFFFQ